MNINILQASDIEYNLDKEKSLITFNHFFKLSDGRKIHTTLTYNSKEIQDVGAFKTTLLPEIQKTVQVAISYGLSDKVDQVVLESGKLARFKENKQVSFKNEAKDPVDYKAYQNLDTLLELKTQKLAQSSDEDKKTRISLIKKIAHVLTSGASVDQKESETNKPKPEINKPKAETDKFKPAANKLKAETNKPKPTTKLKSALKSKRSVQKKKVSFDAPLQFQDYINEIHLHLKRMNKQSNVEWETFEKLQGIFLKIVEKVESAEIKGDSWAYSKGRINQLIQAIEAKRPLATATKRSVSVAEA